MHGQYNRYYVYQNEKQPLNDTDDFESRDNAITFARENDMYKVECIWWNTYEDFVNKKESNGKMTIWINS